MLLLMCFLRYVYKVTVIGFRYTVLPGTNRNYVIFHGSGEKDTIKRQIMHIMFNICLQTFETNRSEIVFLRYDNKIGEQKLFFKFVHFQFFSIVKLSFEK